MSPSKTFDASTDGTGLPTKIENQNNKISEWFHSLNRKNSYNEKTSANKNIPTTRANYFENETQRGVNNTGLGGEKIIQSGNSTPVSILSSSSLVDTTTSSTLSRNALLTSPTNSESTIFNEDDAAFQSDTLMANNNNYNDLTATNKQKTPLEFSRYIKCVHKVKPLNSFYL